MPSIKQSTIEKIKELSITDEISRSVVLKRGKGLCPFHDEKTPSFSVNELKGFYHCFGCGASGDIIKFVQEYHKKTFAEAIEYLADANNVSVEYKQYSVSQQDNYEKVKKEKNDLYDVYQAALKFYRSQLQQSSKAKQYLVDRKISDETINQFQLGFAPGDWNNRMNLKRYLLEKGYSERLLTTAKLIKQDSYSNGEYVDFFFDRLIIPILDTSDRVIAFGGRAFGDIKPKYINSEESPIFSKRNTLFALNFAKKAIQKQDQAILVEGYFDVIALHQAGINTAIASLGTALTPEQVKLVCRCTASNKIVLALDADQAGQNAVIKIDKTGVDTRGILQQNKTEIFSGNLQFHILTLPHPYKDPDEYLKENPAKGYQALIDSAPDAIAWGIYQICKKASDYKQTVKTILTFLAPLESETLTQQYLQETAYQLSLRSQTDQQSIQQALFADFRRLQRSPKVKKKQEPKISTPVSKNSRLKQAERLIVLFYIYMEEDVKNFILDTQEKKEVFLSDNECVALWSAVIHAEHKMQSDETLLSVLSQQNVKIELSETEELDLQVDGERAKKILDECFNLLSQHKEEQMLKALLNSQYLQQDQINPAILQQIERMKRQVMQKEAG